MIHLWKPGIQHLFIRSFTHYIDSNLISEEKKKKKLLTIYWQINKKSFFSFWKEKKESLNSAIQIVCRGELSSAVTSISTGF